MAYPDRRIRFRMLPAEGLPSAIPWKRIGAAAGAGLILGILAMAGATPSSEERVAADPEPAVTMPVQSAGPVLTREEWLEPILERSLFDASKAGQEWDGEADLEGPDLPWMLVGTLVAEPETYSSAAIVGEDEDARTRFYGLGDPLSEEAVLVGIETDHVVVRLQDGTLATLRQSEPAERDSDEPPVFRRTRSDHFEVNDAALALLYDADHPLSGVRTRAHDSRRGKSGVRLTRVGRRTPLYRLGLRRNDIVHTVNGQSVAGRKDLASALRSLRTPSEFTVEITRRRRAKTLHYDVR